MCKSGVPSAAFKEGVITDTHDAHPGRAGWVSSTGINRFPSSLLELPVDLQYLSPDKQREPDADIRKMLIEAIMLVSRGP